MNDNIAILIEYIGEQTKPVQPVAFTSHWPALTDIYAVAGAGELRAEAREHLCTAEEMSALASIIDGHQSKLARAAAPDPIFADKCLAVTQTRGRMDAKAMRRRVEVDRPDADAFLDAIRNALDERHTAARRSIELLRSQIL